MRSSSDYHCQLGLNWRLRKSGEWKVEVGEMEISNYQFQFCWFSFADADIFYATAIVLPFRLYLVVVSLSPGRWPAVMNVFAFQAMMSSWIENFFWLEKPNFHNRRIYSAAWISSYNPAWKAELIFQSNFLIWWDDKSLHRRPIFVFPYCQNGDLANLEIEIFQSCLYRHMRIMFEWLFGFQINIIP